MVLAQARDVALVGAAECLGLAEHVVDTHLLCLGSAKSSKKENHPLLQTYTTLGQVRDSGHIDLSVGGSCEERTGESETPHFDIVLCD